MPALSIDRTTVLQGPAIVQFGGQTFYSKGDITMSPQKSLFSVDTSRFGKNTDQRLKDIYYKVSFVPSGEITNALLAVMFPYISNYPGASIFGATDSALVILGTDGIRYTFPCSAVSKMPELTLQAGATAFGAIEFSCIGKKNTAFSAANRLVAIDTFAYPADTLNVANIITTPFVGRWATTVPAGTITGTTNASPDVITMAANHGLLVGDTVTIAGVLGDTVINGTFTVGTVPAANKITLFLLGTSTPVAGSGAYVSGGTFTRQNALDQFDTETGFQVMFDLALTPRESDNIGIYDMQFSSLTVKAKAKPLGPTPQQLLAAINVQGATASRGASMLAESQHLYASGTGLYVKIYGCAIANNPFMWATDKTRLGDVDWVSTRSFTGGVPNPLFAISTVTIA